MVNPGDPVRIEYIRPGKETTYYEEDFVSQDEICLRTYKTLPEPISEPLSQALQKQGLIEPHQRAVIIRKTYFFTEPFNLLKFCDQDGTLLGHYSDIGQPVIQLTPDTFQMTDLYLDIWLFPDGRLLELDWDEFEQAFQKQVISPAQADLARAAMQRLVSETAKGIYPDKYLNHFDPSSGKNGPSRP
jgi:predicted RNA-binding protein associated with RNAse of E/G family